MIGKRRQIASVWLTAAGVFAAAMLSGCSGQAASAPTPVAGVTAHLAAPEDVGSSDAPAQGMLTKNIMLCFDNRTDRNITWGFERHYSYVVIARTSTCWPGDGSYVGPRDEFDLVFATYGSDYSRRAGTIVATNPAFGWPAVAISYGGASSDESGLRADARRTVVLAGRTFGVNRYPDYDLTWYSSCGVSCSQRNIDSVKHLEVVFYPDETKTARPSSDSTEPSAAVSP